MAPASLHCKFGTPKQMFFAVVLSLPLICTTIQGSIRMSPAHSQFLRGDRVYFRCDDKTWTVTRNTSRQQRAPCGGQWGVLSGPWCEMNMLLHQDTGSYWCESSEGRSSDSVHITVKDSGVILQVPVLPVTEGQTVYMSCRRYTSSNLAARFHRNGQFLLEGPTGHMTIQHVSASDEGLYQCEIGAETSEYSLLRVRPGSAKTPHPSAKTPPPSAEILPPSERPLPITLLHHLLVLCPYVVSTVLMVSLYRQLGSVNKEPVSVVTS